MTVSNLKHTKDDNEKVTPVFGLTKSQLQPVVDNIAGETVTSFDIGIEHQVKGHYGYGAEKVIPTFSYTTKSGGKGKVTIFIKHFHAPERTEAHHYVYLNRQQAPIPKMYGALTDSDQREIIFLEYLKPIDDLHPFHQFFSDLDRFQKFLAVAARFNAIKLLGKYATQLPRRDIGQWLMESRLDSIWKHACKGELGDTIKQICSSSVDKLPRLEMLASKLIEPIKRMDIGLNHNDFYPDSTGWRRDTNELLILDLETVGFAPRFYDVARWLGIPDDIQPRCCPRRELAQYYLKQYKYWGDSYVSIHQFIEEISILCMAQTFNMLWFRLRRALDGKVDWTEDRDEGRRIYREDLYKNLSFLLCMEERYNKIL